MVINKQEYKILKCRSCGNKLKCTLNVIF